jgi:signal transduction histidine kinase
MHAEKAFKPASRNRIQTIASALYSPARATKFRSMESPRSDDGVAALRRELTRLESERAELFARLAQLESERTERAVELFTMAAHELHTPLQSLLLGTDSILHRLQTSDIVPRQWLLDRVALQQRTVMRLGELMRSLLSIAQLRAGTMPVTRQPVDLRGVAQAVVQCHAEALDWAGCPTTIEVRRPAVDSWDPARIDGALSNLLSNAIKYGAGKPISVVIDSDDDSASIAVRDQGIGISGEEQTHIFERFERGSGAATLPGFGLGLWIARALLRDLGGTIDVQSQPGAGAAFTIRLPRAA